MKGSLLIILLFCFQVGNAGVVAYKGLEIRNFGKQIESWSVFDKSKQPFELLTSDSLKPELDDILNFGVSKNTHYLRFEVNNLTNENLVISFPFPIIDIFEVYIFNNENQLIDSLISGVTRPFSNHRINHQDFILPISKKLKKFRVVVKSYNGSQIILPTLITSEANILDKLLKKDLLMGMFMGVLLIMFFYNLFIYISIKERIYAYYLAYIISIGFAQFTLFGYTYKYLTYSSSFLSEISIYLGGILSGLGVLFFVVEFLHLKEKQPRFYKVVLSFVAFYLIATIFLILGEYQLSFNTINMSAFLGSFVVLTGSIMSSKSGYRPAKFFTAAWSFFLFGVILFVLKDLSIVPYNSFTAYSMPLGATIEVGLLALALADKINRLQNEARNSKERKLLALREKETMTKQQNILLEQKVKERTIDLEETLNTLKNAQSNLVSQEKMASLGQLTAGIAHEINNPINFVSSNVGPLRRDIEDVITVVNLYDELTTEERYIEISSKVEKLKKDIEYVYVLDEMTQLLDGIQDGAERTAEIVKSLKNFSRLDELEAKFANIHEGIDSTLVILKSGIKESVSISTNYDSNIPAIECYPGKLNQVFSNLLINAIQAMTTGEYPTENAEIIITTKDLGENISISIKDNGPGIPAEVREKIFEPFFTTKEVGEGTGLGLSIVFSIIESHKGKIEVNSVMGEGTEFMVTIAKSLHN
ncbi:MAG: sensor histidine kinase [Salibacteraceae bacterium]